ncbi:hypothetical protein JTE90_007058 [Oedothorax gibbosus]|uniref:Uncharacterized protein n=1 Tax=Oedothorax gibbosus TaxID=931172 RepID=A0AAV6U281_9ARAC|nr:hypothetical protein JTE90_007058 [Oedothorax gibbosus]
MEVAKLDKISDVKCVASTDSQGIVNNSTKRKKKVLTEEEYTEKMEKIITRDFFPDLPKLKAQNEYLDAVERGDIAKMHQIQMAYPLTERSRINSVRSAGFTPATFETPDIQRASSPARTENEFDDSASVVTVSEKSGQTLDQFLAGTTSEDNASFQVVMEKSDAIHQQKYPWLYKDEKKESQKVAEMLALPSSAEVKAIEGGKPELVTWAYKNKNALMYVPDGVEFTAEERLHQENRKEISHGNTRFEAPPFDEEANQEAIAEAASLQAKMKEGRVGIDGKELVPGESPNVNGYGFVGTPLPVPGVTDTPIMTWGEIEGTPFRLDGSDTPLPQNPSGQQFKIPNLSARERIALSLADQAAKKHRKTPKAANPLRMCSPFGGTTPKTPLERLQSMSPAARKLACAKLGIAKDGDKALRASYSPSPLRLQDNTDATPVRTPQLTPGVQQRTTVITPSQTQALLKPKRHKAMSSSNPGIYFTLCQQMEVLGLFL